MIDLSLYESLAQLLGPLPLAWDQLSLPTAADGLDAPLLHAAQRVPMLRRQVGRAVGVGATRRHASVRRDRSSRAQGRPPLPDDDRTSANTRASSTTLIAEWMSRHTRDEAVATFEAHDAALAPLYDVSEFMDDPHVAGSRVDRDRGRPGLGTAPDAGRPSPDVANTRPNNASRAERARMRTTPASTPRSGSTMMSWPRSASRESSEWPSPYARTTTASPGSTTSTARNG